MGNEFPSFKSIISSLYIVALKINYLKCMLEEAPGIKAHENSDKLLDSPPILACINFWRQGRVLDYHTCPFISVM